MQTRTRTRGRTTSVQDRTTEAVRRQIAAMGSTVFEVGLFKPDAAPSEAVMLPRVWDHDALVRSIAWLRHQNRDGRNIYIRPRGEHNLSLVDDLSRESVAAMRQAGFVPAFVVETSPGNYQAWVKHAEPLTKEEGTAAARTLADRFGGDPGAADWRHFGRLAGFTNRKEKYRDAITGMHPFVKIIDASGVVYPEAQEFVSDIRRQIEAERQRDKERRFRAKGVNPQIASGELKPIEAFRGDPRYRGDGTRIDLAYAIYALCRGATEAQVEAAIRSRDLSHKGGERRQSDYVQRTIRKALESGQSSSLSR
jgi:RepB DNA-primase from phage plasmid